MSRTPFQFAPPASFSGKKEDFEEFAFKLKAYLALMDVTYFNDLEAIESRPDTVFSPLQISFSLVSARSIGLDITS